MYTLNWLNLRTTSSKIKQQLPCLMNWHIPGILSREMSDLKVALLDYFKSVDYVYKTHQALANCR